MSWLLTLASAFPIILASLSAAGAATIYSYSGKVADERFGTPGCNGDVCAVNGSFTMSSALGANFAFAEITPRAFSFTDGDVIIDKANAEPGFARFFASTDASGNIEEWAIELRTLTPAPTLEYLLQTINSVPNSVLCTGTCVIDGLFAYNPSLDPELIGYAFDRDPGRWTLVATPISAALPLFASALGGLGFIGWSRKQANVQLLRPPCRARAS